MKAIVKVIAHTKFLGVPTDLLPIDKARKELQAEYEKVLSEAQAHNATATRVFHVEPTPTEFHLNEPRVLVRAEAIVHRAGQDRGTDAERLVECAGRACYDSYGNGRESEPYHQHIMDVDHGSVTEHTSLSFFLSAISRGCTHELVRHRVGVAISQRSTRYVDESQSEYVHHPLVLAYSGANNSGLGLGVNINADKEAYREVVKKLEAWLMEKGTHKFTARKQARGAARGYLGNALLTEMVWTCNLRTIKTILKQRANRHADAEIRLLANLLYEAALPYWPTYLGRYQKRACPDGIGYELFDPTSPEERLAAAEIELKRLREIAKTFASQHPSEYTQLGTLAAEVFTAYPDVVSLLDGDRA